MSTCRGLVGTTSSPARGATIEVHRPPRWRASWRPRCARGGRRRACVTASRFAPRHRAPALERRHAASVPSGPEHGMVGRGDDRFRPCAGRRTALFERLGATVATADLTDAERRHSVASGVAGSIVAALPCEPNRPARAIAARPAEPHLPRLTRPAVHEREQLLRRLPPVAVERVRHTAPVARHVLCALDLLLHVGVGPFRGARGRRAAGGEGRTRGTPLPMERAATPRRR
jgi:hypothetical protein